jgi:hypothetical protein
MGLDLSVSSVLTTLPCHGVPFNAVIGKRDSYGCFAHLHMIKICTHGIHPKTSSK